MANDQVGFSFRCVTDEWTRLPMSGVDVEVSWGGHTFDQQGRLIFTLLARRADDSAGQDGTGGDT